MNAWTLAALVLMLFGLAPCLATVCRGSAVDRLAGLTLGSTLLSVILLLLAQGFTRSSYVDTALVLAVLSPAGTLVFTRLLAPTGDDDRAKRERNDEDGEEG